MKSKWQRHLTRKIQETRQWVQNQTSWHEAALKDLDNELSKPDPAMVGAAMVSLGTVALSSGAKASLRILDQDPRGGSELARAIDLRYWEVLLWEAAFRRDVALMPGRSVTGLQGCISDAACLLCFHLSTGNRDRQDRLVRLMLGAAQTPAAMSPEFWKQRCFEPFALRLYARLRDVPLPAGVLDRDLGVYGGVFRDWSDPGALSAVLAEICDYHCRYDDDRSGKWGPEFQHAPFDVFPVEVLAIASVRRQMGLETPLPRHPLLGTALARPPEHALGKPDDPMLKRLEAACRPVLQE